MADEHGLSGFIEMIAFAFAFAAVEQFTAGKMLSAIIALTVAAAFYLITIYRSKIIGRLRTSMTSACMLFLIALFWWSVNSHAGFIVRYQGEPLDRQVVTLIRPNAPITQRECRMFIDPHFPTSFTVPCIVARNDGELPLQPDAAYLSFNADVQKRQANTPGWQPSGSQNGWTNFVMGFSPGKIDPEHAAALEDFDGTPIPTRPIRARITMIWGLKRAEADFTILPPVN
jgi:hypothetical protein